MSVQVPTNAPLLAGADGCRGTGGGRAWILLLWDLATGEIDSRICPDAAALLAAAAHASILAVDIPIGLTAAGPRECDGLARRHLGRQRGSSVFPAPVRPALCASTRLEASAIHQRCDGRGVGAQCWSLFPRIRDMDELLAADRRLYRRVREVHPEVSFHAWGGPEAVRHRKKSRQGKADRQALIRGHFRPGAFDRVRARYLRREVAGDDIADAFAALWTAERVHKGVARTLPERPPGNRSGLTITY